MLVEWLHRRNGHVGPDHTLAVIREKYWVLSGRVVVNQVLRQCFFCRVRRAKRRFPFMAGSTNLSGSNRRTSLQPLWSGPVWTGVLQTRPKEVEDMGRIIHIPHHSLRPP